MMRHAGNISCLRLVTTSAMTRIIYTNKDAHGLPGRGSYEKDLEQIYERAGCTDNVLLLHSCKVAELKKYPPAVFRLREASWRWRRLKRLVAASACATQPGPYGYQEIRRILNVRGDGRLPVKDDIDDEVPVTSIHKNIRGCFPRTLKRF